MSRRRKIATGVALVLLSKRSIAMRTLTLLVTMAALAIPATAQAETPRQRADRAKACLLRANPRVSFERADRGKGFVTRWPGKANNPWGYHWGSVTFNLISGEVKPIRMTTYLPPRQRRLFVRCTR